MVRERPPSQSAVWSQHIQLRFGRRGHVAVWCQKLYVEYTYALLPYRALILTGTGAISGNSVYHGSNFFIIIAAAPNFLLPIYKPLS